MKYTTTLIGQNRSSVQYVNKLILFGNVFLINLLQYSPAVLGNLAAEKSTIKHEQRKHISNKKCPSFLFLVVDHRNGTGTAIRLHD